MRSGRRLASKLMRPGRSARAQDEKRPRAEVPDGRRREGRRHAGSDDQRREDTHGPGPEPHRHLRRHELPRGSDLGVGRRGRRAPAR